MVKAFKNYSQVKDFVLRENIVARYTIARLHRLLPHPLDNNLLVLYHNDKSLFDFWENYNKDVVYHEPKLFNCDRGYKINYSGIPFVFQYAHTINPTKLGVFFPKVLFVNYLEIYMYPTFMVFTAKKLEIYQEHYKLHTYENNWKKIREELPLYNPND